MSTVEQQIAEFQRRTNDAMRAAVDVITGKKSSAADYADKSRTRPAAGFGGYGADDAQRDRDETRKAGAQALLKFQRQHSDRQDARGQIRLDAVTEAAALTEKAKAEARASILGRSK